MEELTLSSVLEDFYSYKTSDMYTAIPCRVVTVRVGLEDQRVDVQPLTNRFLNSGDIIEQPVILNVPVIFPASKKASLTFPVDVGDVMLCVFTQRSIDSFKASTGNSTYTPEDKRRFSSRDAIAIPGLFPFKDAVNDPKKRKWTHSTRDLVIVNNIGTSTECEIRLKDNGNIEARTDQDFYATFKDGLIECSNLTIEASGNFTVNAGSAVSLTSGAATTINAGTSLSTTSGTDTSITSTAATSLTSGTSTSITAAADLAITAAAWNVTVAGATNVASPITNWTGVFNLAGTLAMSGGAEGTATISAPLTISAPVTVTAPLEVSGSVTVTGGDVKADGIGLKSHLHSNPEGGSVGPATG